MLGPAIECTASLAREKNQMCTRQAFDATTACMQAQRDLGIRLIPAVTSFVDQARTTLQLGIAQPVLKS